MRKLLDKTPKLFGRDDSSTAVTGDASRDDRGAEAQAQQNLSDEQPMPKEKERLQDSSAQSVSTALKPADQLQSLKQNFAKWGWGTLHSFGSRWLLRASEHIPFLPQGKCLFYFPTKKPYIAVTIDDCPGYDKHVSEEVLDVLKSNNVRATFFLISSFVDGQETVVKRMVDEGHELANHMVKDEPATKYNEDQFESLLMECEGVITRFVPSFREHRLKWFRPPSAATNDTMLRVLEKHGYTPVLGDVFPLDTNIEHHPEFLSDFVKQHTQPGSIIIIHFPSQNFRAHTLDVLRSVLPELSKNFRCVTLTELNNIVLPDTSNRPRRRVTRMRPTADRPRTIAGDRGEKEEAGGESDGGGGISGAESDPPMTTRAPRFFLPHRPMSSDFLLTGKSRSVSLDAAASAAVLLAGDEQEERCCSVSRAASANGPGEEETEKDKDQTTSPMNRAEPRLPWTPRTSTVAHWFLKRNAASSSERMPPNRRSEGDMSRQESTGWRGPWTAVGIGGGSKSSLTLHGSPPLGPVPSSPPPAQPSDLKQQEKEEGTQEDDGGEADTESHGATNTQHMPARSWPFPPRSPVPGPRPSSTGTGPRTAAFSSSASAGAPPEVEKGGGEAVAEEGSGGGGAAARVARLFQRRRSSKERGQWPLGKGGEGEKQEEQTKEGERPEIKATSSESSEIVVPQETRIGQTVAGGGGGGEGQAQQRPPLIPAAVRLLSGGARRASRDQPTDGGGGREGESAPETQAGAGGSVKGGKGAAEAADGVEKRRICASSGGWGGFLFGTPFSWGRGGEAARVEQPSGPSSVPPAAASSEGASNRGGKGGDGNGEGVTGSAGGEKNEGSGEGGVNGTEDAKGGQNKKTWLASFPLFR